MYQDNSYCSVLYYHDSSVRVQYTLDNYLHHRQFIFFCLWGEIGPDFLCDSLMCFPRVYYKGERILTTKHFLLTEVYVTHTTQVQRYSVLLWCSINLICPVVRLSLFSPMSLFTYMQKITWKKKHNMLSPGEFPPWIVSVFQIKATLYYSVWIFLKCKSRSGRFPRCHKLTQDNKPHMQSC